MTYEIFMEDEGSNMPSEDQTGGDMGGPGDEGATPMGGEGEEGGNSSGM